MDIAKWTSQNIKYDNDDKHKTYYKVTQMSHVIQVYTDVNVRRRTTQYTRQHKWWYQPKQNARLMQTNVIQTNANDES